MTVLITLLIIIPLVACAQNNKENDEVMISVGESNTFEEAEIKDAIDTVNKEFNVQGATLKKLWYDEEVSDEEAVNYLETGKGTGSEIEVENVIVILSEFDVDDSGDDGSFEPNKTYEDWQFVLIRDSETSNWVIDDSGY